MSLPRHNAQRDENEPDIVRFLEAAGCSVTRISQGGVPDLLVGYRGKTILVEVIGPEKVKRYRKHGGLTPVQTCWWRDWKGDVLHKVRSIEEASEVLRAYR